MSINHRRKFFKDLFMNGKLQKNIFEIFHADREKNKDTGYNSFESDLVSFFRKENHTDLGNVDISGSRKMRQDILLISLKKSIRK